MAKTQEKKLCDITAELLHETEKAYLLSDDGVKKQWVAKSLCEDNGDGTFTMPEWVAHDKGFI